MDSAAALRILVLPSTTALLLLAIIGIYGHISLIYVTVKFKYLQSPCNILIALLALGDAGHQLGTFSYAIVVYSGITLISQRTCYWMQLVPYMWMQHSILMILVLGMDRFYCITFPLRYRSICASKRAKLIYLIGVNLLPVSTCILVAVVAHVEMEITPDKQTLCMIASFFSGEYSQYWNTFMLVVTAFSVLIYILNWIIVWKKSNGVNNVRKTLKPVTIILFLTFFGWFSLMVCATIIFSRPDLSENRKTGYSSYAGIGVNATIAANYFVYKYFSSDYKRAFREMWKRKKSDVSTILSTT